MKITISVGGKFRAFHIAEYMQRNNVLQRLVTSYPKFEVKKNGVRPEMIRTVVSKEILQRFYPKITGRQLSNYFICEWYDKLARYLLPKDSDIYHIWSSFALHSIAHLKKHNPNAIICIERGSTHIAEQDELMRDLAEGGRVEPKVIEKEQQEYELADYIFTLSKHSKKTFVDRGIPENKVIVNHLGVSLTEFPFVERNEHQGDFVVGYVGAMSARKDIKGLIEAIKMLRNKKLPIRLLLVGNIEYETFDKNLLNENWITHHFAVRQNQLHLYYKQMNVFVLNSLEDGFGAVVPQALASGIPAITTTNAGAADVIQEKHNGFVIPVKSPQILADRIEWLYENPISTVEMGRNAYQSVQSGLTWDDSMNRYLEHYKHFLASKSSRSVTNS